MLALLICLTAYLVWVVARFAIDRNLQQYDHGPRLPGEDETGGPGSRLQTLLPMLRVMVGVVVGLIAVLTVLSQLGINTAPLIAGAGVFGLAISFGSQSLVRDIISGLFYIWDDAFRVGEYIDTGRLKGTVEALGIRSVKLRHHNGPLHTVPYGQLGAVTNQSRDFATIKFNLRLEPRTDVELVRKTVKRLGIDMQQEPEIAAEVLLPLKLQGIVDVTETALVRAVQIHRAADQAELGAARISETDIQRVRRKADRLRLGRPDVEKRAALPAVGSAEADIATLVPSETPGIQPMAPPAASRVA